MGEKILKEIYESLYRGKEVALASIVKNKGSSPGKKGAMMAVWKDGRIFGTVGGGRVECEIKKKALACLEEKTDGEFVFQLNEQGNLDMQCGGETKVYIKVFQPSPRLLIIGGGHIGAELFKLGKILDFYTVIFEDREEFADEKRFEGVDEIIIGKYAENLSKYSINQNTYIVIVTRGHSCDTEALREVVNRKAKYIGMIGSKKKTEYVMKNLIEEGIPKDELKKVYAPIGLNISSGDPNEIAFGIMSEILLIKNKGSLDHMKDVRKVSF
ncbi:MAG: XdhC/CoxI family protein [Marinisporobacter sp.]|jgi:xanthine dehydrogenase accessory factor|nr:XdhC/CoxI family protein [Marinisporobacter sp.]